MKMIHVASFIGLIAVLIIGGGILGVTVFAPRPIALASAQRYTDSMAASGKQYKVVDCMSLDNDNDGKVTCTAIDQFTAKQQQWHCESTWIAKLLGGSCSDARPVTINGGN